MPQARPGNSRELIGVKLGKYRADKEAGRITAPQKGEDDRILLSRDQWDKDTGEKKEKGLKIVTTKKFVENQIAQLEQTLEDSRVLLADIEDLD